MSKELLDHGVRYLTLAREADHSSCNVSSEMVHFMRSSSIFKLTNGQLVLFSNLT